jgi:hypothetical protein
MRKLLIATALTGLAMLAGACASASSKPRVSEPALAIPPPPPRVVPITAEPIAEPVSDLPGGTPVTSGTSAPRAGRGNREASPRPQGTDVKPDAKPGTPGAPGAATTTGETSPATEPPATPPAPTGPPPQLRTADSLNTEGTVRAMIDRARQILGTVDYRRLPDVRKKAYNDAKKFADQADEALKQGNVVFALGVAGKAETLAKELAGR